MLQISGDYEGGRRINYQLFGVRVILMLMDINFHGISLNKRFIHHDDVSSSSW